MTKLLGLTDIEAKKRHREFGPNTIVPSTVHSKLKEFKEILLDPGGLMLLILGVLYLFLGKHTDAYVMFIAYIPITSVDVVLKMRAQKVLSALKHTLQKTTKVLRDGKIHEISIHEIVVGDALLFEEGQTLAADGTVNESHDLKINESALTGESVPVEKLQSNFFFAGTTIIQGRGIGIVTHIAHDTKFGKIAELLEDTQTQLSPLQKKVNHLVVRIFLIALLLAITLFFIQYIRSHEVVESLIIALTFAMSAMPEEFPIVFTLYLSMGALRLSKHGVLIKSLPSVETLGSVDVICTDKTGTLTEGVFQLESIHSYENLYSNEQLNFWSILACEEKPIDSMEKAILDYLKSNQSNYLTEIKNWKLTIDYPFEKRGKHMTHVWTNEAGNTLGVMKGAIEGVLEHCKLTIDEKNKIIKTVENHAGKGKRVLGLAHKSNFFTGDRQKDENNFTLSGFLIFNDPIRETVKKAIEHCQKSNIEIKMLTGDHPYTAHAVADETGITHSHDFMFTGSELEKLSKENRIRAYQQGAVFSRVLPEQKYELVEALKAEGKIVAMTGDGINDAPALKLSDIGISMGTNATDVARSAAKMILLKNDFNGIVEAVFEGKQIFSNLKRSFSYLISFHTPIVLLSFIPPLLGLGNLLLSSHIVFLELIIHPISAFAFENLKTKNKIIVSERNLMSQKLLIESALSGLLLSLACLFLFSNNVQVVGVEKARTISIVAIFFGNIGFVIAESLGALSKRILYISVAVLLLLIAIISIEYVRTILMLAPLQLNELWLPFCLGLVSSLPSFLSKKYFN